MGPVVSTEHLWSTYCVQGLCEGLEGTAGLLPADTPHLERAGQYLVGPCENGETAGELAGRRGGVGREWGFLLPRLGEGEAPGTHVSRRPARQSTAALSDE